MRTKKLNNRKAFIDYSDDVYKYLEDYDQMKKSRALIVFDIKADMESNKKMESF